MSEPIQIVLLDDHPLVMEGLKRRVEEEEDMEVCGAFTDPRTILRELERLQPQVLIMDISMPEMDGFEVARQCKERFGLDLKMIMLSGYTYAEFYQKAYELGAHAYLSKQAPYPEIINAIRQSVRGHILIPEKLKPGAGQEQLTPTERRVLELIAKEKSNLEIAVDLSMSKRTVEYHITSIIGKLGVKTRIGAVAKGYELGLIRHMY
ncbi:DNA-binding response regulator [Paenibacillus sp. CAA11]|uniref:response regulator transcription factor n=1 Tax=Paenibacillus sp. CAA11 TaxID=1532905 RepID=UPI000D3AB557|nr:response regulator transcription factor [Paenibacillus sp. CAA11]AWB46533.1 DNA-binding response regulator [Paenibacillus sp. CAA11]